MTNLTFASEYASRGWPVFPVKAKGKTPLIKDWPNQATTDQSQVRAWWTQFPEASIGLATGKKAGLFVIDVDGEEGFESLKSLELPTTLNSRTGSGGEHLFFVCPNDREVRNRGRFLPGLDVRGTGGYVVLPPSVHESGESYRWLNKIDSEDCPEAILDIIAPPQKPVMPWAKKTPKRGLTINDVDELVAMTIPDTPECKDLVDKCYDDVLPESPANANVIERARLYLAKCEPAIDGEAGGNALLWAARAMVVGLELSDTDALSLLWSGFNPRCEPVYDRGNPKHVQQYKHKINEARTVSFNKPSGWLLNDDSPADDKDALASMLGNQFAETYSNRVYKHIIEAPEEVKDIEEDPPSPGFPLHCFPPQVREYIELVADVQVVDPAGVAMSVLVSSGGAMGNAFRLRLKGGFDVSPILWGAIISRSGSNKSGPFREIIKPLRIDVPLERLDHKMINPQGQLLIEDATTEAVLEVMSGSPRGLIMANGEGAGWVGSFDRYSQGSKKKVSVDETIWLKMWDCDTYQKNRKTDSENILIHNAACGVLVCIQPKKMAECFDPAQFASGLVPRLLVVYLPKQYRGWSEREMTEKDSQWWADIIMNLRATPFASQDPNTSEFFPNLITPSVMAKKQYIAEFNRIAKEIEDADEMTELFLGKAQGLIGRLALVLHGLGAACGMHKATDELSEQTMLSAIELMQYLVDQQIEVYNLAGENYAKKRIKETISAVKNNGGSMTARQLQRSNGKKYTSVAAAVRDLERLADSGLGEWNLAKKTFTANEKEA